MAYGNNIVHEALKAGRARAMKRCVGDDDVRVLGSAECSSGRWSVSGDFFIVFCGFPGERRSHTSSLTPPSLLLNLLYPLLSV